ncbi:ATP-dependent DNA helicase, partial [mine drainage metagenome]
RLSKEVLKLISSGVEKDKILCITFTLKAKAEMEERIQKQLIQNDLASATPDIETFHSYCNGILTKFDVNPELITERLARFIITRSLVAREVSTRSEESLSNEINSYILTTGKVINAVKLLKSYGIIPLKINGTKVMETLRELYETQHGSIRISLDEASTLLEKFLEVFKDYENYKQGKLFDYQDLLISALNILKKVKNPPYEYILVDELQDISVLEKDIIERTGKKIFAVGDSKQAIFGFQGGNIESFN